MQQNIRKSLAKANKERGQIKQDEKKKNSKKRSNSSLLRMLAAQMVPSSAKSAEENMKRSSTKAAVPFLAAPLAISPTGFENNVPTTETQQQQKQLQAQQPGYQNTAPTVANTKPCPLCGGSIQLDLFDQHMQEELTALAAIDDDDDDSGWGQQSISLPIQPSALPLPTAPKDPKVYILGGIPAFTVPRNPKKLKPLPEQYRRQIVPVKAYNYYADGGGNMDGDEIGLDGFENVGVGWEGVGATTF